MIQRKNVKQDHLEDIISYLLIAGVIISLILECTGLFLYVSQNNSPYISSSPEVYIKGSNFFLFIADAFGHGYPDDTGLRLMADGILVLICTPFLRVVFSAGYFVWVKNWKYSVITLVVLTILVISLLFH